MGKFKASWVLSTVMAGAVLMLSAAPAAAQSAQNQRMRVVVAFKPGAAAAMRAAIANAGGRVLLELAEVNAVAVDLPRRAFAALQRSPHAEFVEEDSIQHIMRMPAQGRRSGVAAVVETTPYGIPMVQADQVSDASAGNRTLCIVDSGIDSTHEDLPSVLSGQLDGFNYTTSGDWFTDENSHGTHVAGTVAALGGNGLGVVGVMPGGTINLFIAKVFDASGSTSSSVVAKAMLGCKLKGRADVISMSLGGSSSSMLQQRIATFLASRGVLMIAAAGNAGTSAISYPAGFAEVVSVAAIDAAMAKASFSQFNPDVELAGPGVGVLSTVPMGTGLEATTTVGATPYVVQPIEGSPVASATGPLDNFGFGDTPVPGSMTGKVCLISRGNISFADKVLNCQTSGGIGAVIYNNVAGELFATLGGVVTTIPSVGALQTDGALMLGQLGQSATVALTSTNYALFNGTSMATPHVSAVAALVWSRHTVCTAAQMRDSLNKSAMDLGALGRDDDFGFGLVQAKAADDRITSLGCGN